MKQQMTHLFFLSLLLTFSLGTYLSFGNSVESLYFFIFYAIALYILRRSLTEDFYISSEKNRFEITESKILLQGESLPAIKREDQQEERYLNHFNLASMAKRQFFTYFLLALGVYLLFYKANVPLGLSAVIPVICGLLFIKSVFVGHLLFPLGLNIYSVVAHYHSDQGIFPALYPLYLFMVFLSLHLMSGLSGKQIHWKKNFAIIPVTLFFCGSLYGLNFIFDDEVKKTEMNKEMAPVNKAVREIKRQSTSLLSNIASLPDSTATSSFQNKVAEHLQEISQFENMQGLSQERKQLFEKILRDSRDLRMESEELKSSLLKKSEGSFPKDLEDLANKFRPDHEQKLSELKEELARNQEELLLLQKSPDQNSPTETTKSDIQKLEKKRDDLKAQFEKLNQLTFDEKQQLQEYITKKQNELSVLEKLGSNTEATSAQRKNLKELQELSELPRPGSQDLKQISEKLKATKDIGQLQRDLPHPTGAEIDTTSALKTFEKQKFNWKKILPLIVLFLVMLVATIFMRKKGIKEIQVYDSDLLNDIKAQWKDLKKLNLSPREEVIHFYNILHDLLQKVHYAEHETPPSCIVFEDMKDFNPKLDRATYIATEVYCRCFYGNKEVTTPDLKSFRKSIATIFRVYGI